MHHVEFSPSFVGFQVGLVADPEMRGVEVIAGYHCLSQHFVHLELEVLCQLGRNGLSASGVSCEEIFLDIGEVAPVNFAVGLRLQISVRELSLVFFVVHLRFPF